VAAGLEADAVDGRVDLAGAAEDLLERSADVVGLQSQLSQLVYQAPRD